LAIQIPTIKEQVSNDFITTPIEINKESCRKPQLSQNNIQAPNLVGNNYFSACKSEDILNVDNKSDFHYERLNEQDEKDLGFDDLVR
jgi:hypothetical protein